MSQKKYLLELIRNQNFAELKEILVQQITSPTNTFFDSSENYSDCDIAYNNCKEQWKKYGSKYQVSNLGRIKYKTTNFVIPQININQNLYLDKQKWKEKCYKFSINTIKISSYTKIYYEYIASTWLEEEKEAAKEGFKTMFKKNPKSRLEIHHINNCENDNRVDNLIYLNSYFHNEIHKIAKANRIN